MAQQMDIVPTHRSESYPYIDPSKANQKGKHIFITGASKGVGRATATAFARAGASGIALAARSSLAEVEKEVLAAAEEAGHPAPKVVSYNMDVIDRDVIESTAQRADKDFSGRIDILINNAGYLEKFVPIVDSDPDEWWKTWTVNIRGVYLVTRAFLPIMLKGGDKQIVNLSSVGALRCRPGGSGYQMTKFALLRFTEFIMSEYGTQGILAFSVHPGGIVTELVGNMPKDLHGILTDKPDIAGDTMCFLTSQRQDWLAGRYVNCTWDMEEFFEKKNEIIERDLLKFKLLM